MESLDSINEMIRAAYNVAAARYHELFRNEMQEKEFDRHLLDRFAAELPVHATVCDAGCGPSGHIGKYLFEKGLNVTGVDISDACIAMAKELNPGISFVRADCAAMPFDDASFDGIIHYYSIIHTPKVFCPQLLREAFRVLKPGGQILLAVKEGVGEGVRKELLEFPTDIYFSEFQEEEIRALLSNAGFHIRMLESRMPYDFEINTRRIFAAAFKTM